MNPDGEPPLAAEPPGSPDGSTPAATPPSPAASQPTPASSNSVRVSTPTGLSLSLPRVPPPSSTPASASPPSALPEAVSPMEPPAAASPASTTPPAAAPNPSARVSAQPRGSPDAPTPTATPPSLAVSPLSAQAVSPMEPARPAAASPARTAPPASPPAATSGGLLRLHPANFSSGASSPSTPAVLNDTNTIFVTNLSSHVTAEQLRLFFEDAGEVRRIRVYEGGAASIEFRYVDALNQAFLLHGMELDDMPLYIHKEQSTSSESQPPPLQHHLQVPARSVLKKTSKSGIIYVTNHSCDPNDPKLLRFFQKFGEIVKVQPFGGTLSIEFEAEESATKAAEHNGEVFIRKPIYIQVALPRRPCSVNASNLSYQSNAFSRENLPQNTASGSVTVYPNHEPSSQVNQIVPLPQDTRLQSPSQEAIEPYQLASAVPTTAIASSRQLAPQQYLPAARDHRLYWRRILFLGFGLLVFHSIMVLVHYLLEKNRDVAELSGTCSDKGKDKVVCQVAKNTITIEALIWSYLLVIFNAIKLKLGFKFGWGDTVSSVSVHSLVHTFTFTLFHYIEAQEIGNSAIYSLMLAHAVVFTVDIISSFLFWYLLGTEVDLEEAEPRFDPSSMA